MIYGFNLEHRWLSNFWPSPIWALCMEWPTAEHLYQAAKTTDDSERARIARQPTPAMAKKAGRMVTLRPDWEDIKLPSMEWIVKQKFVQNHTLREMLLDTGDQELIEANTWGDTFWGVCRGVGENHLGQILMKVRQELSEATSR
jgi:ribA/ribD-fused uncharacterized protein